MNKNIFIQLFLIILLLFSLIIFSQKYFFKKKNLSADLVSKPLIIDTNENILKNITYNSKNKDGILFELKAEYGIINFNFTNKLALTNVKGSILLKNGNKIFITSKSADFDNQSFETKFKEDVKIISEKENITGDMLHVIFDKSNQSKNPNPHLMTNTAIMYGNIIIKRSDYQLNADIVELNLISLNSKVYMRDKNNRVNIKNN